MLSLHASRRALLAVVAASLVAACGGNVFVDGVDGDHESATSGAGGRGGSRPTSNVSQGPHASVGSESPTTTGFSTGSVGGSMSQAMEVTVGGPVSTSVGPGATSTHASTGATSGVGGSTGTGCSHTDCMSCVFCACDMQAMNCLNDSATSPTCASCSQAALGTSHAPVCPGKNQMDYSAVLACACGVACNSACFQMCPTPPGN